MASLLTNDEKNYVDSLFDDLHDTFKTTIYAFVEESTTIQADLNYNPLYNRTVNQSKAVTNVVKVKYPIEARVFYQKLTEEERLTEALIPSSNDNCRLKIKVSDYEIIKKASIIEVNGENYKLNSKNNYIGPFSKNYVTITLQRTA